MRHVLRLRSMKVAILVSTVLGLSLSASRLLGVHGVESALAMGVVLPPFVACVGGALVLDARRRGTGASAVELLRRTSWAALLTWAPAVLVLALNQLRVRQCEPLQAFGFMVLGPGLGILLAAFAGVLTGGVFRRGTRTLATLVPVAWIGVGLWEFWSTPAIFVYGQFGGWFPGTLYDDDVRLDATLLGFRATTLVWLVALGSLAVATWDRERAAVVARVRRGPAFVGIAAVAAGVALHAMGPEVGHRTSNHAIEEMLGATLHGERCVVHVPRELERARAERLRDDCDYRVHRAELALGVTQRTPVHAYFYRSLEEKRRWMGAARVYIAKPWRDEVHLQLRDWPHSVLAHEVVHVVAKNASRGPFEVAGAWGGLLPNPGWIEGIAVAVEWPVVDGMDPHQHMAALRELDRLPPLETVMSTRFMTLSPRVAYGAAGSFVAFLLERYGSDQVRDAHRYATTDRIDELESLETEWHAHLEAQRLPDGALALTELRYRRSSIFATTCPHRLARLRVDLAGDLAAGDDDAVLETCDEMLAIEPAALSAQVARIGALARRGEPVDAAYEALEGAPPPVFDSAREAHADALWERGELAAAAAIYEALLQRPQTEGAARGREVKLLALREGGEQANVVRRILIDRTASAPVIVHLARRLDALRTDGLGAYLESRQLLFEHRYELALERVEVALERSLPSARLTREAQRMEAMCLFVAGRLEQSEGAWRAMAEDPLVAAEASDWLARIAYVRER